jgi:TRAP-type C4-dicarboxylate transport system permease small subunit
MQPTTEGPQEHVLTASGEFDVHDEPIDLAIYHFEDWISFVFFWLLAGTVFLQFFTRYALNDSAGWTEEIARYLLICTVFIGAAVSVRKNNHIQVDFSTATCQPGLPLMAVAVDLVRIAFFGSMTVYGADDAGWATR